MMDIKSIQTMSEKELTILYQNLFGSYGREFKKYCECSSGCRDMFFGQQLTDEEEQMMKDRNQFIITINKIRTSINDMASLLTSNLPEFKANPMGENDTIESDIYNRLLKWVFNNSKGNLFFRDYIKSGLRDNISWCYVYVEGKKILLKKLNYNEVIVDKTSTDIMMRDARFMYVEKYLPEDVLKATYGIDGLAYGLPEKARGMNSDTGYVIQLNALYDEEKRYFKVFEGFRKESYKDDDGEIKDKIIMETIIGTSHVIRQDMDKSITNIPLVPFFSEATGTPYPLGEAYFLQQLQKFTNKTYGVVLLNAMNTSSSKVFLREADIIGNDRGKLQREYNGPGNLIILAGDSQNSMPPTVISGQPLNQSFFTLYQDAQNQIRANTIPEQASFGNQGMQEKLEMEQYYDMAMNRLKNISVIMEEALSLIGTIVIQFVKAYIPGETILSVVDADKIKDVISLNNQVNFENDASIEQYKATLAKQIGDIKAQAKVLEMKSKFKYAKAATGIINSTKDLSEDICIVAGSYEPSFNAHKFSLMYDFYQTGLIKDVKSVLRYAPIDNKDELFEREDLIANLAQQSESLQQALEEKDQELKQMKKKLEDMGVTVLTTEHKAKLDKQYGDTRAALRVQKIMANANVMGKVKDVNHNIELTAKEKEIDKLQELVGEVAKDKVTLNDLLNIMEVNNV